jgi:hypothetical protein
VTGAPHNSRAARLGTALKEKRVQPNECTMLEKKRDAVSGDVVARR